MSGLVLERLMLMPTALIKSLSVTLRCKNQGFVGEIKLVTPSGWSVPINIVVFREVYGLGCYVSADR
jgi:hypothetical protein